MYKPLLGTGPDIQAVVAESYKKDPTKLGPIYVSAVIDFFFLGVFFHQLSRYYSSYRTDQPWIRRLVIFITVLSTYKAIPAFISMWDATIANFGDWMHLGIVSWTIYTEVAAATIINTAAQTFFAWRCFTLTGRNWYLLGILAPAMLIVLGLSFVVSFLYAVDPFNLGPLLKVAIPMIVFGFIIDIIITGTVSYKLLQYRGVLARSTDGLLTQLLSITWEAAAPPALSQAMNVIFFATMGKDNAWHLVFNMMTSRLYVFSLMYTLNSRADVRQAASAPTSNQDENVALSSFKPRKRHELYTTEITTMNSIPETKTESHLSVLPGNTLLYPPRQTRGADFVHV